MPMDTLKTVLARIKKADYRGRIHPYVQEPLCDPRLVEIVGMIRAMFPENVIFINTNGDLLTLKLDGKAPSSCRARKRLFNGILGY